MRRNFNIRMALTNIKNNQNIYLPYFMAASLIVMLFYSLRSVSFMVANSTAAGGGTMSAMLQMSSWICGILSLVILFYVNSFIMKRRKKEFGLYSILGMEKRHIALVMAWEVLITGRHRHFLRYCAGGAVQPAFVFAFAQDRRLAGGAGICDSFSRGRRQHLYCSALLFDFYWV